MAPSAAPTTPPAAAATLGAMFDNPAAISPAAAICERPVGSRPVAVAARLAAAPAARLDRPAVAAVFATAILTMMPTLQFSGLLQPVSTLEGGARVIGSFWPTTYFHHLSVGAFTKGLGLQDLGHDLLALAAFVPVFLLLSRLALPDQDR